MGAPRPPRRPALAAFCFAAVALLAAPAVAQTNPYGTRAERGFGNRDSIVFSVENIFGFEHAEFGGSGSSSTSIDSKVMQPFYWGNVGLFGVFDSGLSLGGLVGATHEFVKGNDLFTGGHDFTILRLKPRIGYAGSVSPFFGYWVRGGPSLFTTFSSDTTTNIFSFGGEAYAVVTPVPHLGILVGPNADIYIYGRNNHGDKEKLTEYGLMCGLMGEFW